MKYGKIMNLLDDRTNQPFECRTRNWVGINDESRVTCNAVIKLNLKLQ